MINLRTIFFIISFVFLGTFLFNIHVVNAQVESKKTLHFVDASSNNFPPMNVLDKDGKLTGFGRELADAVLKEVGAEITHIHSSNWMDVLKWLDNGKADFIHDTGYTEDRDKFLDYSKPIIEMPETIFVRPEEYSITDIESLKGKTVACVNKHITHLYLQQFPEISLFVVKSPAEGVYELISGKVDAFVYPRQIVLYLAQHLRLQDKIKITGEPLRTLTWSMVVKEGNTELLQRLNEGIAKVRESGQYDRIYEKWWGKKVLSGYTKEQLIIFTIMITGICMAVMLSITLFFFSRKLKQKVKKRTVLLSKEKEFINAVLENIEDGIVACDKEGILTLFNRATREFHHLPGKPIPAEEWSQHYDLFLADGITPMQKKDIPLFCALQGTHVKDIEMVISPKHGEKRILLASGQPLLDDHGNILGAVVSMHDVTERKYAEEALNKSNEELETKVKIRTRELQQSYKKLSKEIKEREGMEKQLQQAHKMESIGLMAGGVAHDLNNILSGITGYPELLLKTLPKDSELRAPIEAIHESGRRAATVVADLLTVARGIAIIREKHDLNTLTKKYLHSPEYNKLNSLHPNITCRQHSETVNSFIFCSPVHVQKCLMNLVTNAFEAITGAGTITVSTYNQSVDETTTSKHEIDAGEYVVLNVQDTGSGISKEDIEHIFEPFYTKKVMGKSGSGLGLAVVWNSMEDHDGKVIVDSNENGTSFKLYFPVKKGGRVPQTDNEHDKKITGGDAHILVVDDEPQLRDIARMMLTGLGYSVDVVESGESAIEFIKKKPVDLLLIDMLMEPGLSGRQTYEEITKLYPNQKAVVASGFSESEDVKVTLQLGAGGFIMKPYSTDQLGQVIKEVLDS